MSRLKYVLFPILIALLGVFLSCDLENPSAPIRDNPWDANNPYPPRTPTELTGAALSSTTALLQWKDMSGCEEGTEIEESFLDNRNFQLLTTVVANETIYTVTDLEPFSRYFFRIRAANRFGKSLYSNEVNLITPNAPPRAPSELVVTGFDSASVSLAWQDNSGNETGFAIERKVGPQLEWSELSRVSPDQVSYTDINLNPAVIFTYRVRAYNDEGYSAFSNEATATTSPVAPMAPSGLSSTVQSARRVELGWQDNSNNEFGFNLYRKMDLAGEWNQIAVLFPNVASFIDTAFIADTIYYYRVNAYNSVGVSDFSNEAAADISQTPPEVPSNLTAYAASATQIDIMWRDNSLSEIGFKVERKSGESDWIEIADVGQDVVYLVDSDLIPNTTYYYRVRAFNPFGVSPYSNEAAATTHQIIPAVPSGLVVSSISPSQLNLSWNDNS